MLDDDAARVDESERERSAPDASIRHDDALAYWSSTPATVDGMLGGFGTVSKVDLQGSKNFVAKLLRKSAQQQNVELGAAKQPLGRAADCGAGIGRITAGLLCSVASVVDVVDPVPKFTAEITKGEAFNLFRNAGKIGEVHTVGLQDWTPGIKTYDLIWNQWVLGQLTDHQLVEYLRRCGKALTAIGWVVVKENLSTHIRGEDTFDHTDSSVTRTEAKFKRVFQEAGMKIVAQEVQRGLPKALYPVKTFALQPEAKP